MTQIGFAKDIFSESICANGRSWQKVYRRGCGEFGGCIDLECNCLKRPLALERFPASHQEV